MQRGHNAYRQINTMGLSQIDLILTVYRGTIGLLDQARKDFSADKNASGRIACEKARKCIVHLYTTLNMEKGQDIARHLGQLYAFMIQQIDLAMASKSIETLTKVRDNLATIKEGWEGLKENDASRPSHPGGRTDANETAVDGGGETSEMSANRSHVTLSA